MNAVARVLTPILATLVVMPTTTLISLGGHRESHRASSSDSLTYRCDLHIATYDDAPNPAALDDAL